jgi:hypothetical protein
MKGIWDSRPPDMKVARDDFRIFLVRRNAPPVLLAAISVLCDTSEERDMMRSLALPEIAWGGNAWHFTYSQVVPQLETPFDFVIVPRRECRRHWFITGSNENSFVVARHFQSYLYRTVGA